MISCQTYRASLSAGTQDAALLEHMRRCDACLDFSVETDPDNFFRAIGGETLVPPGGVDAFVGDVMREVQLRGKETSIAAHRTLSWRQRLAIAATVAIGITGGTVVYRGGIAPHPALRASLSPQAGRGASLPAPAKILATKPLVDSYSRNATIVEVPNNGNGNVNVVMIFDDKLPADL